jgi:hypothetical protein
MPAGRQIGKAMSRVSKGEHETQDVVARRHHDRRKILAFHASGRIRIATSVRGNGGQNSVRSFNGTLNKNEKPDR